MKNIKTFVLILTLSILISGLTLAQENTSRDITITRDEIKLKGNFYPAEGAGPITTVILLHGFPGNEIDVLGVGQKLSESGINALTFNYSGTYQSDGLFSFDNTQKDIKAAYDFAQHPANVEKFRIDTTEIILGGYSYGGGMALTYAANHPEITNVFSIAGTDHGEFFREYFRNEEFKQMIDKIFEQLTDPQGPVRFSGGGKPKDVKEESFAGADSTYDLRKCASLLSSKNILLIGGWDDVNVTMDHHMLPLYRALQKENADKVTIVAFQDDHSFNKVRSELAGIIINWLTNSD
ncbi:MAG: alpha/beta fold hydrolase [Syntrophaceae bacterium]|nr:alpha/beta fold hydrolase [Syntrophaceae bacterium]